MSRLSALKLNILEYSLVTENDPTVRSILSKYQFVPREEEAELYDTIAKMAKIEEAKKIVSMIHDGDKIKIVLQLENSFDLQNLLINIFGAYCPQTREHGKMKCGGLRIYTRGRHQYLSVEYECMHPECRIKRSFKKYLPRLWAEAKDVIENVKFLNIVLDEQGHI